MIGAIIRDSARRRKHLIAVESLPPNEYLNEEGVTLVNQYVELKEKKRV